jgi:hypothetical protein
MAKAAKLALQQLADEPMRNRTTLEIISHLRKSLQLVGGNGVDDREEVSNGSAVRKGERDMKVTVHYFVHLPVHSGPGASEREKGNCAREAAVCGRRTGAMWAGATLPLCTRRAQQLRGVAPAHTFASTIQFWNQT